MRLLVIQNSFNFLFTFVAASLLLRLLSGLNLALQSFFQVTWELVSWNFSNFFWVILSLLCGLLASNSSAAPKRSKTTTPIQALAFWNGPFTQNLSESYSKNHSDFEKLSSPDQKINHVFNHLLQRQPLDAEKSKALALVEQHGFTPLIRAILNTNEFLTLE